jgi:hypothetical protein
VACRRVRVHTSGMLVPGTFPNAGAVLWVADIVASFPAWGPYSSECVE